ncbi:ParB/RepB/Spo0J family partition protein [Streptomyces zaehneri]|uniref:ParB/RepB/Spo0J family partition protein n=1 Tax=Streptomyces zaehneri TaxID=3051180 RepID=UPI0028D79BF6|nr:ParB N-terminal domain-containing protein [Streptomyces sp. DSM 40713]
MAAGASGPTMTFGKKKKSRSIWDDPDAVEVVEIPLEQLHPNPFNPRLVYRDEDIDDLTESIKAEGGVLQDLSVAEVEGFLEYWRARLAETQPEKLDELEERLGSVPAGDYVTLIGHNRAISLARAGHDTAPCKVTNSKIPRARLLGLPENMRRIPLNPIEEALGFQGALDDGLLQAEVAAQTGCRQPHISRRIKLLKLPTEVQKAVMDGLAVSEAEILLDRLPTPEHHLQAWLVMKEEGIKAAFAAAKVLAPPTPTTSKAEPAPPVPQQQKHSPDESRPEVAPKTVAASEKTKPGGSGLDSSVQQTGRTTLETQNEPKPDPSAEAAQMRVQACRTILELGVPSNPRETLRLLAPALLAAPSKTARETAHEWLQSAAKPIGPNVSKPDKYFAEVSASGDARLTAHVAVAVALAVAEQRAANDSRPWDVQDRDYLAHLKSAVNYQPTNWELDRLGGK